MQAQVREPLVVRVGVQPSVRQAQVQAEVVPVELLPPRSAGSASVLPSVLSPGQAREAANRPI